MTGRRVVLLAVAAWLAVTMALLLIGPAMSPAEQQANCVYAFPVTGWLRLLLNCDTAEFIRLAGDPAALLEPGNDRQSRPLFIGLAVLLSWLWKPVGLLLTQLVPMDPGATWRDPAKVAAALRTLVPAYLGYLTINVAVLLGAVGLALRMLPAVRGMAATVLAAVLALLVANDVVKAFVWSPHTQMLNIAMPILATWLILRPPGARGTLLAGLLLGVAMLAYGNAAIGFAGLAVGVLAFREGVARFAWLAVALALFALPGLAWSGVVRLISGDYYVVEMRRYGELVWIAQSLEAGRFVATAGHKVGFMLWNALQQAVPLAFVGAYLLIRLVRAGVLAEPGWRAAMARPLFAALAASLISLGFFTAIGWEAGRLAYAAIPPLIWLAAMAVAAAAPVWRDCDAMVVAGAVFADTIYVVAKAGPLS